MWRPDGWEVPYAMGTGLFIEGHEEAKILTLTDKKIYEAGADAILEALRKSGVRNRTLYLPEGEWGDGDGTVVFIPDEEKP